MLTVSEDLPGLGRRTFLKLGGWTLGGLTIPALTAAAGTQDRHLTGKSVVFLFQQGGPSQLETFDPKPHAPLGVRTMTDSIETSLPGVFFGGALPLLAERANQLTVVRSFQTQNGGHNIQPLVSEQTLNANLGSLYSSVVGALHPQTAIPTNAVLFPQAVDAKVTKGAARGDIAATGKLPQSASPFVPGGGGQMQRDMRLNLSRERFDDRRYLLAALNQFQDSLSVHAAPAQTDVLQSQAQQVLMSDRVFQAFDLSQESPETLKAYDTSRFVRRDGWNQVARGKRGYYSGHARTLGKLLLLARRLCEAGCGFITIHADYDGVWDMHADSNNLGMIEGMQAVGRSYDHAVSVFLDDLSARGLSDRVLLVSCGEMGRTPKVNRNGGRDHWARLAPLMFAGGGARAGSVIGQSTADAGEPATQAYGPENLVSTVLHTLFDVTQLRLMPHFGTVAKLAETAPIPIWT